MPHPTFLMFFEAPGFKLLSRVLVARVSGALILAYVSLRGFHYHFEIITTALIVLWMRQKFATNQDTKVCGALTPPQVKESSFKIISSLKVNHETGDLSNAFHEWSKQYGNTFTIKIFGQTRIMTLEPDHLKAILATKFDDFWKGPIQEENFNSFLGSGVFNSDDKMWKFHRSMTRPFFSKVRVTDSIVFEKHMQNTLESLQKRLEKGFPVDVQDSASRFTLDSATEFLFGQSMNSISADPPFPSYRLAEPGSEIHSSTKFMNALAMGQDVIFDRISLGPYWKLVEFTQDKALAQKKIVEEFLAPIVDATLKKKSDKLSDGNIDDTAGENFLQHLVNHTQDRRLLMDELINILIAARDTTTSLITFSLYMVTQFPNICDRLRIEILEHIGNERPTYEKIREMKYMRAFLNEVLRLYPPVPNNQRTSKHSTTLPSKNGGPFHVPSNTSCIYSVFLIHRREDLWGPDALKFDPDRFLDERLSKYLIPNPYIFLPFNAGPRICLGQQFAYNQASYFLIRLLQKFSTFHLALNVQLLQPPGGKTRISDVAQTKHRVILKSNLTMSIKGGLWIRMLS